MDNRSIPLFFVSVISGKSSMVIMFYGVSRHADIYKKIFNEPGEAIHLLSPEYFRAASTRTILGFALFFALAGTSLPIPLHRIRDLRVQIVNHGLRCNFWYCMCTGLVPVFEFIYFFIHLYFGSYDESEQQSQEISTDDESEGVNVHENEHEGEVTFDTEASTTELVDQLHDIKDTSEEKSDQ